VDYLGGHRYLLIGQHVVNAVAANDDKQVIGRNLKPGSGNTQLAVTLTHQRGNQHGGQPYLLTSGTEQTSIVGSFRHKSPNDRETANQTRSLCSRRFAASFVTRHTPIT
jgi:hypothetical protein